MPIAALGSQRLSAVTIERSARRTASLVREAERGFRPDIQGLRAVAVALVLLYHANVPFVTGGYVGVDVFFVISGFLITGHLTGSLSAHGRIRFARFYARRVLRIVPAAFAVVVATAVALIMFAPIPDLPRLLRDARAAALYFPNVRFADLRTDYLADHAASPFEHYWSLGVEEQFYLAWPLILAVIVLLVRRRWALVTVGVALVAVLFLGYGVWLTRANPPGAFFLLQSRAWELLVGGLVALLARQGVWLRLGATRQPLGWAGIAAVIAAALLYDDRVAFPGVVALLPVLGTAAVIAAGTDGRVAGLDAVLAAPPAQFAGRISYSLYLVHLPLVLIPQVAIGFHRPLPLWATVLLGIVVALPVGYALHCWIEEPLRAPRALVNRPFSVLGAMAATTGVIAVALTSAITWADQREVPAVGLAPSLSQEPFSPPPATASLPSNLRPTLEDAPTSVPAIYGDGCMLTAVEEDLRDCTYGTTEGRLRIALFGDSHSAQWFPALLAFAEERGDTALSTFTKTSCPAPAVTTLLDTGQRYESCDRWRASVLDTLTAEPPDIVVFSSYSWYELADVDVSRRSVEWDAGTTDTVTRLREAGSEVLVIADTPKFLAAPATCAAQFPRELLGCAVEQAEGIDAAHAEREAKAARSAGARTADFTPFLCDGRVCPIVLDDLLAYRDTHHLSVEAVEYLAPRLGRVLAEMTG